MMSCRLTVTTLVLVLLLPGSVRLALAQNQQVAPPSLDDALFGDLGQGSVDPGVEKELFGERTQPDQARRTLPRTIRSRLGESRRGTICSRRSWGNPPSTRPGTRCSESLGACVWSKGSSTRTGRESKLRTSRPTSSPTSMPYSSRPRKNANRAPANARVWLSASRRNQPKPSQPKEGSSNPKTGHDQQRQARQG